MSYATKSAFTDLARSRALRAQHYCKMQSVFRAGLFKGKVAIVTGGGTGIGKAIARELLYLGSKVVISSRKEQRLQKAADELSRYIQPSSSSEVKVVPCNIREEQQVKALLMVKLSFRQGALLTISKLVFRVNLDLLFLF